MTSGLSYELNAPYQVEELFRRTCSKLTEAEVNCSMFLKMIKSGVATNDVRNFVNKQCKMKKADQRMNLNLTKCAMRSKLNDACRSANRLRQEKKS